MGRDGLRDGGFEIWEWGEFNLNGELDLGKWGVGCCIFFYKTAEVTISKPFIKENITRFRYRNLCFRS